MQQSHVHYRIRFICDSERELRSLSINYGSVLNAAPFENNWWRFTANHRTVFTDKMRMTIACNISCSPTSGPVFEITLGVLEADNVMLSFMTASEVRSFSSYFLSTASRSWDWLKPMLACLQAHHWLILSWGGDTFLDVSSQGQRGGYSSRVGTCSVHLKHSSSHSNSQAQPLFSAV